MPTQNEKPIIFPTAMIPKILDGTKTMTRRVIKPQPRFVPALECGSGKDQWEYHPVYWYAEDGPGRLMERCCLYGQVGDRQWVRESHFIGGIKPKEWVSFKADASAKNLELYLWRPSIHMPRWASRIDLEITEVRVERVQEITAEEVIKEGCQLTGEIFLSPQEERPVLVNKFERLWDSLNAKRGYGWEVNPWVWCISFKVIYK